jgi:hypothetical protein
LYSTIKRIWKPTHSSSSDKCENCQFMGRVARSINNNNNKTVSNN